MQYCSLALQVQKKGSDRCCRTTAKGTVAEVCDSHKAEIIELEIMPIMCIYWQKSILNWYPG